jgi:hypothetical protein
MLNKIYTKLVLYIIQIMMKKRNLLRVFPLCLSASVRGLLPRSPKLLTIFFKYYRFNTWLT